LVKIEDVMHQDKAIPRVSQDALLADALMEMTQKRMGFTTIVDPQDPHLLLGIFTDGDLRRVFERGLNIHQTPVGEVMTTDYKFITIGTLASEAIGIMETMKSFVLPVLNDEGRLVGALNMHDLLRAGVL
jgi:arabinose-5-phosphate isomerase